MRGREVEIPVAAADGRGASSVPVNGARPAAVPEEGLGNPVGALWGTASTE